MLGVGGRDLSAAVGGLATLDALAALDADPATERVLLVSKPPAPPVAAAVAAAAGRLAAPVRLAVLSAETPGPHRRRRGAAGRPGPWPVPAWPSRPGTARPRAPGAVLKGFYAGGTLADEAMLLAAPVLGDIRSNIPLRPELDLGTDLSAPGHVVVDFGDDALTVGRAHPMIDPTLRLEAISNLAAAAGAGRAAARRRPRPRRRPRSGALARPGARPRPARHVPLPVVVALVGTDADPQGWSRQADALAAAGAAVFASNAAAVRYALEPAGRSRR